jgi:hypothetical protein
MQCMEDLKAYQDASIDGSARGLKDSDHPDRVLVVLGGRDRSAAVRERDRIAKSKIETLGHRGPQHCFECDRPGRLIHKGSALRKGQGA